MTRNGFVVVQIDDETNQVIGYWNGSNFGEMSGAYLFDDKIAARSLAGQMQQDYQTSEVVVKTASITVSVA